MKNSTSLACLTMLVCVGCHQSYPPASSPTSQSQTNGESANGADPSTDGSDTRATLVDEKAERNRRLQESVSDFEYSADLPSIPVPWTMLWERRIDDQRGNGDRVVALATNPEQFRAHRETVLSRMPNHGGTAVQTFNIDYDRDRVAVFNVRHSSSSHLEVSKVVQQGRAIVILVQETRYCQGTAPYPVEALFGITIPRGESGVVAFVLQDRRACPAGIP